MTMTTEPATTPAPLSDPTPVDDPVGWEPPGSVYCAVIIAETAAGGRQQVASTRWASEGEARGFIERRLPTVMEIRSDTKVSGFVMPAVTRTEISDGELRQHVTPQWGSAQRARINSNGYVYW